VAGAGASSTAAACQLAEAARRAGAEATLQVTPYYNRPTQDGLYRHFVAVAEQSEIPVILYNIPGRTGVRLEVETIARLAQHPLIVAIKEATGDLGFASRLRQQAPELVVLSGDDALTLPLMALGARGVVSVASNVLPAQVVELVEAMAGGDPVRARECHFQLLPFFAALFLETNPIPVKAALALRGLCGETLRLPLVPAQDATRQALRQALSPWDVP
jgi:4-hydroxy-tetrahydrodipicolinate synthase